jgi:hypothetical protein
MGGEASAKKRSWQAQQREKTRALLSMKLTPELLRKLADNGVNLPEGADFSDGIDAGMLIAAMTGDARAYKAIKEYGGASSKTDAEDRITEAQAAAVAGDEQTAADDGFIEALKGSAAADWAAGGDE